MPTDDRDQQFERALTRHLSSASPDSACPDAETLAAYHERTLSLEELARWKEHIAACSRCQETLALVEQTESVPAAVGEQQSELVPQELAASPAVSSAARAAISQGEELRVAAPRAAAAPTPISQVRPRPPWRWIIPVGALAASVIVWVGTRELHTQHLQQMSKIQVAENRAPLPQPAPAQAEPPASSQTAPSPALKSNEETRAKKALPPTSRSSVSSNASGTLSAPAAPSISADNAGINKQKDAVAGGIAGAKRDDLQAPAAVVGYAAGARSVDALGPPPSNQPAPAVASPPPADRKEEAKKALVPSAAQTVEVQSAAPAPNAPAAELVASQNYVAANLLKLASSNPHYIISPGEKHAWLLGDAGTIQHSTDRGKTWKPQLSGVTADLTAGSATSDKICWVVGKAGTLLLTTDGGKHWKTLSSPITGDLGGIHATDALHASIWDVPNRQSYQTTDGGLTWTRMANE